LVTDRSKLMQRGWAACVSSREANAIGACPQTMAWLWDLAAIVMNNTALLHSFDAEQLEAWVGDHAAKEAMAPIISISRVLAICEELKTWDMDDLPVVNALGTLDKLARRHVCAVAQVALTAMAEAAVEYPSVSPGLRALLRLTVEAESLASQTLSQSHEASVLGRRADHFFEAVTVYLEGEGVVDPEDVASVLIAVETKRQAQ
jgi:hypothetical protein